MDIVDNKSRNQRATDSDSVAYIKLFSSELRRMIRDVIVKSWRIIIRVVKDNCVIDSANNMSHHHFTFISFLRFISSSTSNA